MYECIKITWSLIWISFPSTHDPAVPVVSPTSGAPHQPTTVTPWSHSSWRNGNAKEQASGVESGLYSCVQCTLANCVQSTVTMASGDTSVAESPDQYDWDTTGTSHCTSHCTRLLFRQSGEDGHGCWSLIDHSHTHHNNRDNNIMTVMTCDHVTLSWPKLTTQDPNQYLIIRINMWKILTIMHFQWEVRMLWAMLLGCYHHYALCLNKWIYVFLSTFSTIC